MIPLRDVDSRARGVPAMTVALMVANALVFLLMQAGPDHRFDILTFKYAAIPGNITGRQTVEWMILTLGDASGEGPREEVIIFPDESLAIQRNRTNLAARRLQQLGVLQPTILDQRTEGQPLPPVLTLLTSMFMHGSFMHILGNMLFLWVFGGRLEYRLGRPRFLIFYVVTGILAGLGHVVFDATSPIPTVGASGAISGLLGGYVLLFPHGRILTLVPFLYFLHFVHLPAFLFVAIWVGYQVLLVGNPGSVAVWAHLGGFAFGLALIKLILPAREPPPRHLIRPRGQQTDPFEHFRQ